MAVFVICSYLLNKSPRVGFHGFSRRIDSLFSGTPAAARNQGPLGSLGAVEISPMGMEM